MQSQPNEIQPGTKLTSHHAQFGEEKKKLLANGKKRTKIIERYNVGIKSMGPLANKTHEIVLNYKTGEEGSKWKTNAAKDTNDKKKKNTPPPLGPG